MMALGMGLVLYRVTWTTYEFITYDEQSDTMQCECFCSDSTMSLPDLNARVRYHGPKLNASCDCIHFLIPRMSDYLNPMNVSTTCEICQCDLDRTSECSSSHFPSFRGLFDVVTATILGSCMIFLTITWIHKLFDDETPSREKKNKKKRTNGMYFKLRPIKLAKYEREANRMNHPDDKLMRDVQCQFSAFERNDKNYRTFDSNL